MSSPVPISDIVAEARRLMTAAEERNVAVRLLGGLAVRLGIPEQETPVVVREYKDIDLAAARGQGKSVGAFLQEMGYEADRAFNATNGHSRLLFWDVGNSRQVDVFVGSFEMCHQIPIADRLLAGGVGIPLAELLLTKLQVVELNAKDASDIHTILFHHEVADDDAGRINADQVAKLCASDWGLWRTTKLNLERIRDGLPASGLSPEHQQVILDRLHRLWERIETQPKSRKWKLRSRIGDKVRWYEEPEEVAQ
jgi:hypothetical protein